MKGNWTVFMPDDTFTAVENFRGWVVSLRFWPRSTDPVNSGWVMPPNRSKEIESGAGRDYGNAHAYETGTGLNTRYTSLG